MTPLDGNNIDCCDGSVVIVLGKAEFDFLILLQWLPTNMIGMGRECIGKVATNRGVRVLLLSSRTIRFLSDCYLSPRQSGASDDC